MCTPERDSSIIMLKQPIGGTQLLHSRWICCQRPWIISLSLSVCLSIRLFPTNPGFQPKPQSAEEMPTIDEVVIMEKLAGVTTTPFPLGSMFASDAAFRALGLSCRRA